MKRALTIACAVAGAVALIEVTALAVLIAASQPTGAAEADELPIVYDTPAEEMMTVYPARTDGAFYDLPDDIHQATICDHNNREYAVLWTDEGGLTVTPLLEKDGSAKFMPQA